jgi:flagellar biosynthesis GTPase FlhF
LDLPPNMPNSEIGYKLSEYGEILSIKDEVWGDGLAYKGIKNGVRIVRMVLKRSIPSYITVNGEVTYVTYLNQPPTCRWCNNSLHFGMKCSENRQNISVNGRLSFADALKNPNSQQQQQQHQQSEQRQSSQQQEQQQQQQQQSTQQYQQQQSSQQHQHQITSQQSEQSHITNQNNQNTAEKNIENTEFQRPQQEEHVQVGDSNVFFSKPVYPAKRNTESAEGSWADDVEMSNKNSESDASSISDGQISNKAKKAKVGRPKKSK